MEVPRGRAPERLSAFPQHLVLERLNNKIIIQKESCQPFTSSEITLNPYPDCTKEDRRLTESLHFGVRI